MTRREFTAALAAPLAAAPVVPRYLRGFEKLYAEDPRAAAIAWFRQARFGLFLHFGLYSLLGRGEWVQYREKIPVAEYAKLSAQFHAGNFDAGRIADLAVAARMRYITITTRHHDSFCLFRTGQTRFTSLASPARRDLITELAQACDRRGLGLCFYYSHGRDWRHPHAPNNDEWGGNARPEYNPPEPSYAYGKAHHLEKYLDFMTAQITELLTQYGPIASIWLDGIAVPYSGDRTKFHCAELYRRIRGLQPQVLISYKQGLLGSEDYLAPESKGVPNASGKPMEICSTLQLKGWGYVKGAEHLNADQVMDRLRAAAGQNANLLLNTGPLPDGSIYPGDAETLTETGRRLRRDGYPALRA
ncbi:MAG: alpha-L-fucosidase [Bryobacteraceae bacterium]